MRLVWTNKTCQCPQDPHIEILLKRSHHCIFFLNLWKAKLSSVWKQIWPCQCKDHLYSIVFCNLRLSNDLEGSWWRVGRTGHTLFMYTLQASLSQPDSSPARWIKWSLHVQNAFIKKDNNYMPCLSCLKGSRRGGFLFCFVFLLSTLLNRYFWGWLVSFSQSSWGINDHVAQCSKVTQTICVLSQSEHWMDSGKNFPLRSDLQRWV